MTDEVFDLIRSSKRLMVFTGAGMSTASNIPDFRSKEGIYQTNPERILSRQFFFDHTEHFYDFFFDSLYHPNAKPNKGHEILVKWEKEGKIIDIVTQNIDGLHQKAGSLMVTEFHGTVHQATCYNPKCKKNYSIEDLRERREEYPEDFYLCSCKDNSSTKRYIKPDVVLFDEKGKYMSNNHIYDIRERMWLADVILVLGSSLKVYPFRSFIDNKPHNKPMLIINKERVYQECLTKTVAVHADISETLGEIDAQF